MVSNFGYGITLPQGFGFLPNQQGFIPNQQGYIPNQQGFGLMPPDQQGYSFVSPIPNPGYGFIPPDQQSNFGGGINTEQQQSPLPGPGFGYTPQDQQYNPQGFGVDVEEESDDNFDVAEPKKKKKKDPNKPKKPRSPWLFFSIERRKELKEEKPDLPRTELNKEVSKEWKSMSE